MWDLITISIEKFVVRAKATAPHTRECEEGARIVPATYTLFVDVGFDCLKLIGMGLARVVVVVTFPHNMVCRRPSSLAVGVWANVGVDQLGSFEPVWSPDTSSQDCFE